MNGLGSGLKTLKVFNSISVSGELMFALQEKLCNLEQLSVRNCGFTERGLVYFLEMCGATLNLLYLQDENTTGAGLTTLREQVSNLEELDLMPFQI